MIISGLKFLIRKRISEMINLSSGRKIFKTSGSKFFGTIKSFWLLFCVTHLF